MFVHMNLDFKISPVEQKRFEQYIKQELLKNIQKKLKNAVGFLQHNLQYKIYNAIESDPGFHALISGNLRYDMGITSEEALNVTQEIASIISKTLQVELIQTSDNISLNVNMIREGYKDILDIKTASFIQTFTRQSPYEIPWLKWLLLEGDKILIGDHHIKYIDNSAFSRTGGAIMVKRGSWRVPPEFSGTEQNNIITRALSGIDDFVFEQIQNFL